MDVLDDFNEELRTQSDLLANCGKSEEYGMHPDEEEEVILRPKRLADLLNNKGYAAKSVEIISLYRPDQ